MGGFIPINIIHYMGVNMRDNRTFTKLFAVFVLILVILFGILFVKDKGDAKLLKIDVNIAIKYYDDKIAPFLPDNPQIVPLP